MNCWPELFLVTSNSQAPKREVAEGELVFSRCPDVHVVSSENENPTPRDKFWTYCSFQAQQTHVVSIMGDVLK